MTALSLLCLMTFPVYPALASDEELEMKTKELDQVKKNIQDLSVSITGVEQSRKDQEAALEETDKKIGEIARNIRVVKQSLDHQGRRLAELEKQRADARLSLDGQRQALELQIRAAYAMGRQQKMKIMLNQQDPALMSRVMIYYDYLNQARIAQMKAIGEQLDQLRQIERQIRAEEIRLHQLQERRVKEQAALAATQQTQEALVSQLNRQLKSKGAELDQLRKNEKQLESLLSQLRYNITEIPSEMLHQPFNATKGQLPWPSRGVLAASFGSQKGSGKLRWDGVLIASPEGREVRAVHHGRVAFSDWLRGFGLLLIIDHGDGYMSLYGYNQSLFKETGEWVESGEIIAQVGNSGGRTQPGVYFGIRKNGTPVDPKSWCKRIKGRQI